MFFPERIVSIKPGDRVLEVGPGGTPFHRSDVLLEKSFNEDDALIQRGYASALVTDKAVIYFDGGRFPFDDLEFDYVICSHVLEHVDDVVFFTSELSRVARLGYLEFPTIYYDYIYNIPKHVQLLLYNELEKTIFYMPKNESGLDFATDIQDFFFRTTFKGYTSLIQQLKPFMFQGIEWDTSICTKRAICLGDVLYDLKLIDIPDCYNPSLSQHVITLVKSKIELLKSRLIGLLR